MRLTQSPPHWRLAREYSVGSALDNSPLSGSMRRILIPPQKLPQLSQTFALVFDGQGGIDGFQSSVSLWERSTMPWSSVGLVASPMAEFRPPNEDAE
jgi:hypothetical protein